jgi:magnesium-transporting ATPase (P-type)
MKKNKSRKFLFDSNKKRMTTFIKERNGNCRLFTKGGSENIKKYCKYF